MSMPPVLTETARPSRSRSAESQPNENSKSAARALEILEQHVLLDGFRIVLDDARSRGSYLFNAASDSRLIDFYGFFGSMPVGYNHPHFAEPAVQEELARAASIKIANSDVYSPGYAEFVETLVRVAGLPPLERYLFIEGGALAIENTLKAAMDWKVRKNIAAGRGGRGGGDLHFPHALPRRRGDTQSPTHTPSPQTHFFAQFK